VSRRTLNSADHDKWEMNRMMTSGAIKLSSSDKNNPLKDMIEIDEDRVILMVHDIKPPFLDGRMVFTTQTEPI
jgi:pre-mRNA-splicing factor ATP-dependent RNA helicase DHX38/PRP16